MCNRCVYEPHHKTQKPYSSHKNQRKITVPGKYNLDVLFFFLMWLFSLFFKFASNRVDFVEVIWHFSKKVAGKCAPILNNPTTLPSLVLNIWGWKLAYEKPHEVHLLSNSQTCNLQEQAGKWRTGNSGVDFLKWSQVAKIWGFNLHKV